MPSNHKSFMWYRALYFSFHIFYRLVTSKWKFIKMVNIRNNKLIRIECIKCYSFKLTRISFRYFFLFSFEDVLYDEINQILCKHENVGIQKSNTIQYNDVKKKNYHLYHLNSNILTLWSVKHWKCNKIFIFFKQSVQFSIDALI